MLLVLLGGFALGFAHWIHQRGSTLWYGDAEAHLNIARRVLDSRTPGPEQIGTVWLPVPHAAMIPFVGRDRLWMDGTAGAAPGLIAYLIAALFLYGSARRVFGHSGAAAASACLFALNPNLLYLQAVPMTEPYLFAGAMGILYATVWFRERPTLLAAVLAGLCSNIASLTRYEAWFFIPFVALYFLFTGGKRGWPAAILFGVLASAGPLAWLAHNQYYNSNAIEFYNGPYSAKAIYQRALDAGMDRYPGDHDWSKAIQYFATAVRLNAGWALTIVGCAGALIAALKRYWWPLAFLLLPPVFYVLSMYSSGTPIFVPILWPNSYYNTRYGLAALPLLAFGAGALVRLLPDRWRAPGAALVAIAGLLPFAAYPRPDGWITWKESQVNSESRRAWTSEAAAYLKSQAHSSDTFIASFGDLTGVFREAGIPLRRVVHEGNGPEWYGAIARPDLFLHQDWAVALSADAVAGAMLKSGRPGIRYQLVHRVEVKGAPVVEIYRRTAKLP